MDPAGVIAMHNSKCKTQNCLVKIIGLVTSPRVSKGDTFKLRESPLLTRGLVHLPPLLTRGLVHLRAKPF